MLQTSRRRLPQLFAYGLLAVSSAVFPACSSEPGAQTETAKPNILFILVDDLGWADVGCFGSKLYETPNIDRLASQGMKFTNAYAACPVCSPTRASIMTGRYPVRQGITNYIRGDHRLPYSAVIPPKNEYQLPLEEVTIAEALRGAGYATGHIGKWHLGDEGFLPQDQGFDYNYAGTRSGMPRSFFFPQWTGNPPVEAQEGEYLPDHLTDHALEFIEGNQDKPFFLYLPFYAVHIPIEAKEEHVKKFEAKLAEAKLAPGLVPGQDQHNPIYAGMIYSVDENIGRLTAKLDELGIAGNTIIFFMSDNGGLNSPEWKNEPVTSNAPLRNGKGHLYEGGIREPLIIKWPGVTAPGSTSDVPVNSVDFFPTMLGMAGAWKSRITSIELDGVNLEPLLKQQGSLAARELYWHYPHYSNQLGRPGGAVRQGDLKLIEFYDDDSLELYNLTDDIGETNNLAEAMPDMVKELRGLLDAWRKSVGAKMPAPNPDYDPDRADLRVRP